MVTIQEITKHLESQNFWVTKDFKVKPKDHIVLRVLKNLINKICCFCFGRFFYQDIAGERVLESFQNLLKENVSLRRNKKTISNFLKIFDRVTKNHFHIKIENIYHQYVWNQKESSQKQNLSFNRLERSLKLLTRTDDLTKSAAPHVCFDWQELALSWKAYCISQSLLDNESIALKLNAIIHELGLINSGKTHSEKETVDHLTKSDDFIFRIRPLDINEETLSKIRMLFLYAVEGNKIETIEINPHAKENTETSFGQSVPLNQAAAVIEEWFAKENGSKDAQPPLRVKIFNRVMRHILGEDYPIHQLMHKAFLMQQLLNAPESESRRYALSTARTSERHSDIFKNKEKREWVRSVIVHMEAARQKLPPAIVDKHKKLLDSLTHTLTEVHLAIIRAEKAEKIESIPSPAELHATLTTPQYVHLDKPIVINSKAVDAERTSPIPFLHFDSIPNEEFVAKCEAWVTYMTALKDHSLFDRLDRAAAALADQFRESASRKKFIESMAQLHLTKMTDYLFKTVEFIAISHLGLLRPCLPANRVRSVLQIFSVMQLLLKKDQTSYFEKLKFDASYIKFALQDPYLDLGIHGPEINHIMQEWESLEDNEFKWSYGELLDEERAYLALFGVSRFADIESPNLPASFRNARKAYCFLTFLLNPAYTVSVELDLKNGRFSHQEYVDDQKRVQEKLKTFRGEVNFSQDASENYALIQPLGLRFYSFSNNFENLERLFVSTTSSSITNYIRQKEPLKYHERRKRIAEALVVEGESKDMQEQGSFTRRPQGMLTTQQVIQDEQLAPETCRSVSHSIFKQLELMQTAFADRLRNTLIYFTRFPHLLADKDWQRICELNFFKYESLYMQLKRDFDFPDELIAHLNILNENTKNGVVPLTFFSPFVTKIGTISQQVYEDLQQERSWPADRIKKLHEVILQLRELSVAVLEAHEKQVIDIEECADKQSSSNYFESCLGYLSACAAMPVRVIPENTLIGLYKRYFWLKGSRTFDFHEDRLASISDCIDATLPKIRNMIEQQTAILTQITGIRLGASEKWQSDVHGIVWTSNSCSVNLQLGCIFPLNAVTMPLPVHVRQIFGPLLADEDARRVFAYNQQIVNGATYYCIECVFKNRDIKVYFTINKTRPSFMLMKMEDGLWYQKQSSPFFRNRHALSLNELLSCTCWYHYENRQLLFLNNEGELRYSGKLDADQRIQTLKRKKSQCVYLPTLVLHESIFARISDSASILVTGTESNITSISYSSLKLDYEWDQRENRWNCLQHPGYHLVSPSDDILKLFPRRFIHYHVLQNSEGKLKLLLSKRNFIRHLPGSDVRASKHSRAIFPISNANGIPDTLFSFDFKPDSLPVSESPEGNLYLSYVYYTLERYSESIFSMRHGFLRLQGLTDISKHIIAFWKQWEPNNATQIAILMRFSWYVHQQQGLDHIDGLQALEREDSLEELMELYQKYRQVENLIPIQFRLSEEMQKELQIVAFRAYLWANEQLFSQIENLKIWELTIQRSEAVSSAFLTNDPSAVLKALIAAQASLVSVLNKELHPLREHLEQFYKNLSLSTLTSLQNALHRCFFNFNDLYYYVTNDLLIDSESRTSKEYKQRPHWRIRERDLLAWSLEREIKWRLSQLPVTTTPSLAPVPLTDGIALFDVTLSDFLISQACDTSDENKALKEQIAQLSKVFADEPDTLAAELTNEVIEDAVQVEKEAKEKDLKTDPIFIFVKPNAELSGLIQSLEEKRKQQEEIKRTIKLEITAHFCSQHSFLTTLREQNPFSADLFHEGFWCFGFNNWQNLEEQGIIQGTSVPSLKNLYRTYLLTSTSIQQINKVLHQIERYQRASSKSEKEVEGQTLIELLQQKRFYSPEDPLYAPCIMLLEHELEIICTQQQIRHFREMIAHRGSFEQVKWGDGKTSFLRHLLMCFFADGQHLSGIATHGPLINSHHPELRNLAAACYGQRAIRIEFSRASPTDPIALRREFLKLIKLVLSRGRIDQTIHSLLSMHHAYDLLTLHYLKHPVHNQQLFLSLQTLGKILQFFRDRLILGSDELDEIVNPGKQDNYATGPAVHLQPVIYETAISILEILVTYSEYSSFFQNELHPRSLTANEREDILCRLIKNFVNEFSDIPAADLTLFFTPIRLNVSKEEFDHRQRIYARICSHPQASRIQCLEIFLSKIVPISLEETCGVEYGRSAKDGIRTRPLRDSVCQENSQHGSNYLQVWLTCLDYLRNKVDRRVVAIYVARLREKVHAQNATTRNSDDTSIAKEFFRAFNIKLQHAVSRTEYQLIADIINNPRNLSLKINCLRTVNFETMTIYERRITGNGRLAAQMVKEMWGFSGNSEGINTFPRIINRHPHMVRQKGVISSVFFNLIKDFSAHEKLTVFDQNKPFSEFLATLIKPGSAYVDVAPFFAGVSAENASEMIQQAMKQKFPVLYSNLQGRMCIRLSDGSEADASQHPSSIDNRITLLMLKDRRGIHVTLPPQGIDFMSISSNTTRTDASQGGMRARNWGKGRQFVYIVDQRFAQQLQDRQAKTGYSLPVLMSERFARNEASDIMHLQTIANQQEIKAKSEAIRSVLQSIDNPTLFRHLATLANDLGYLEQVAVNDPAILSRPARLINGEQYLKELVQTEIQNLSKWLKEALPKLSSDPELRMKCQHIIGQALNALNAPDIVMPAKHLSPIISAKHTHGGEEEVELQAEFDEESAQQVDIQSDMEIQQQEQKDEEVEETREEPRHAMRIHFVGLAGILNPPSSILSQSFVRPFRCMPNNYFLSSEVDFDFDDLRKIREEYGFWLEGKWINKQLIADSVLVIANEQQRNVSGIVGNSIDAANGFQDYSTKYVVEGYHSLHIKLREVRELSRSLEPIPEPLRQLAMERIIFAKLIYADCMSFYPDEIPILQRIWQQLVKATDGTATRHLKAYLERHSLPENRELLRILSIP